MSKKQAKQKRKVRKTDLTRRSAGFCALTRTSGFLVDCHLIPKAFTSPSEKGGFFVQAGEGTTPIRRWSSWYDPHLVTAAGELILRDLDTWAIELLRRRKLVWSGWEGSDLSAEGFNLYTPDFGARLIEDEDSARLRRFFLSLLWRAAASHLPEFQKVQVSREDLESLRLAVLGHHVPPVTFYPVQICQLHTKGPTHNQTPLDISREIPSISGSSPPRLSPAFRFYFDGLITHFICPGDAAEEAKDCGNLYIGVNSAFAVPTFSYESSFQKRAYDEVTGSYDQLFASPLL